MRSPGVKKALTSTNEKLRRSSQVKTQVTRYAYNDYMVHQYAFAMKVASKQEPERPSLHHRLEGENRPNRNRPNRGKEIREEPRRHNKAVKNHATKPRRTAQPSHEEPRKEAAQQSRARKLRRAAQQSREEPRRKDASRSTDFATTHNASWNTDSAMSMRIDASRSGLRIPSETDLT